MWWVLDDCCTGSRPLRRLNFNRALDSRFKVSGKVFWESWIPIEAIEFQSGPGFKIQDSKFAENVFWNLESWVSRLKRLNFNRGLDSRFKILRNLFRNLESNLGSKEIESLQSVWSGSTVYLSSNKVSNVTSATPYPHRVIHQFWFKSFLLCPWPSPPYFKEHSVP